MPFFNNNKSASLVLHTLTTFVLVAPDSPTGKHALQQGTCEIRLAKPKVLTSIEVIYEVICELRPPGKAAHNTILYSRTVELLKTPREFAAGQTTLKWEINVDRSTPTSDRTLYGRIFHRISAKAKGVGSSSQMTATPIYSNLYASSADDGSIPHFELNQAGLHDALGVWSVNAVAKFLAVAGAVSFRVSLNEVIEDVRITSVSVFIEQCLRMSSPNDQDDLLASPSTSNLVCRLTGHELKGDDFERENGQASLKHISLVKGSTFELERRARMPDSDLLRPSTNTGTVTPLRISHNIRFEIEYFVGDRGATLRISQPITLYHCVMSAANLDLPSYTPDDPQPDLVSPDMETPTCMNSFTLEDCFCNRPDNDVFKELLPISQTITESGNLQAAYALKP